MQAYHIKHTACVFKNANNYTIPMFTFLFVNSVRLYLFLWLFGFVYTMSTHVPLDGNYDESDDSCIAFFSITFWLVHIVSRHLRVHFFFHLLMRLLERIVFCSFRFSSTAFCRSSLFFFYLLLLVFFLLCIVVLCLPRNIN